MILTILINAEHTSAFRPRFLIEEKEASSPKDTFINNPLFRMVTECPWNRKEWEWLGE